MNKDVCNEKNKKIMKNTFTLLLFLLVLKLNAQVVIDTVSLSASYNNQKWYSLQNDDQGTSPKNNWDIAFECGGQGYSILINSAVGTMLWTYPDADTSGWTSLDTSGIAGWTAQWNSETDWSTGAFNANYTADPNDLGWGIYSMFTHYVTGDSLYVIKLANGSYKKLWVRQLASSAYYFTYANIDGSNSQDVTLMKSTYSGKNFGYYSIINSTALDREPISNDWDLSFQQYTTFLPSPYTVTGVLSNYEVEVAKAENINDVSTYVDWANHPFYSDINTIGYNWKAFSGGVWTLQDSLIYFVKTANGDIWKMIFTGFGGSSNGNFILSKEKLSAIGIDEVKNSDFSLAVYPNPSNSGQVTIIYDITAESNKCELEIIDMSGKIIESKNLMLGDELKTISLNTSIYKSGIYIVRITTDQKSIQQKLIIQQ